MEKCEVFIKTPIKESLIFDFECVASEMKYMICNERRAILLSGKLLGESPYQINIIGLIPGKYNLKIVDGEVWGNNPFVIA